jgi:hypothetical protein
VHPQDDGVALAAAAADRRAAQAAAAPAQLVHEHAEDAGARGADRVPEGVWAPAPPLTFTRSSSMLSMRIEFSVTDAKASLISHRSMSPGCRPALSSALTAALAGVVAR